MKRSYARFALSLGLALSAGFAAQPLPARADAPFVAIGSFKLPGELEVVTQEDHSLPRVAVQVWLKAGSAQDFVGYPGLAEATAQALWAGGAQPLHTALVALGGQGSVTVGRDYTCFAVSLPAEHLNDGLDALGAALAQPTFAGLDAAVLHKSLLAMIDQARQDPDQRAEDALFQTLYSADIGHAPVGDPAAVGNFAAADLQAFGDRFYMPSLTKVVLVGDFATGKSIGQCVRSFARLLKRTPAAQPAPSRKLLGAAVPAATSVSVAAGARGPAMGVINDLATMDVLAHALADEKTGRLTRALVGAGLATRVTADWHALSGPGALMIVAYGDPARTDAITQAIRATLSDLRQSPLSLDEHARALQATAADYARQDATFDDQAHQLGYFATQAADARWAREYPDVIPQISRQDLLEAAQKYLNPDDVKVVVVKP